MLGVEVGWLQDRVSVSGRVGPVCAEELGSIARSREVEGLTLIRVGLVTEWVGLLVVWTGPLALGVGLVVAGVDSLTL